MKNSLLIVSIVCSLLVSFLSCSHSQLYSNLEEIKIIRVISSTDIEIIQRGNLKIITLAGINCITENEFQKKYIETGLINKKYAEEISERIKKASVFLSNSVSPGDYLYAKELSPNPDQIKVNEFVIFAPDKNSINVKMISAGYAFPGSPTSSKEFDDLIKEKFRESVRYQKGLWRIGREMLKASNINNTGNAAQKDNVDIIMKSDETEKTDQNSPSIQ